MEASRRRLVIVVITVAAFVIVAGSITVYWIMPKTQGSPISATTGLDALARVESLLSEQTGRSWVPFADLGIASSEPFTPWALGGNNSLDSMLAVIRACGSLPFPTVWNVSGLPYRSGNLTDGFAPFWQFLFENESATGQFDFAIGVYDSDALDIAAPLSHTNACITALGLTSFSTFFLARPNLETNVGGPVAYNAISAYDAGFGPYDVIWTNGWSFVANSGWGSYVGTVGSDWGVTYYACGQSGVSPSPNEPSSWHAEVGFQNGTPSAGGVTSVRFNCTLPTYQVSMISQGETKHDSGFAATLALQVTAPAAKFGIDAVQGLATWMVRPMVVNSSTGSSVAIGPDGCSVWISDLRSCPTPAAGYYAVLMSPNGAWLDSYGVLTDGVPGWSAPNVPLLTNDSILLLSPNAPGTNGESIQLATEVSWPTITSSITPV